MKLPFEKLKDIEYENHTEDQRRVAMLDTWQKREGKAATYMKLASALYQQRRLDLVNSLCRAIAVQSSEPLPASTRVSIGSAAMMDVDRRDPESSKLIVRLCFIIVVTTEG